MSSEAALLDEISKLSGAINRQRGGQPAARRGRGSGWRGTAPYNKSYRSTFTTEYNPLPRPGQSSSSAIKQDVVLDGVTFQSDGRSLVKKTKSSTLPTDKASDTIAITALSSSPVVLPAPVPIANPSVTTGTAKPLVRTRNGLIAANLFKTPAASRATKRQPRYPPVVTGYPKRAAPGRNLTLNKKTLVTSAAKPRRVLNHTLRVKPKRKTFDKQCKHFTRTGMCGRGLTCKYQHDPSKIALCPLFLAEKCPFTSNPAECSLSHDPTPERTPLCTRFNSTGQCYKGSDCLYPHIRVGPKKGVCRDFAVLGFCDKGALCDASHFKECPDFAETGKCSRMGLKGAAGCHLPHVIRANQTRIGAVKASTSTPTNGVVAGKRKIDGVVVGTEVDVNMCSPAADPEDSTSSITSPTLPAGIDAGDEFISLTIVESEEEDEEDSDGDSDSEGDDDEENEDGALDAAPSGSP